MKKELKFREIIENIIDEIIDAKKKSEKVYGAGNIKSSGSEVEDLVREKISLFLPERYLVKQGHIVNNLGQVSHQFDIIIFDRLNTPKFFESKDNTVFYPIESVLAVGEIKKTLRKNDVIDFKKKIKHLKVDMNRPLIENSIYKEKPIRKASFLDMFNMTTDRKYKNPLFSFLFAIDVTDFSKIKLSDDYSYMPNDIYILNYGYLIYGLVENKVLSPEIEDENPNVKSLIEVNKSGIYVLGYMFSRLIAHLNLCYIEPFSISEYMQNPEDFGIYGADIKMYSINQDK